MILYMDCQCFWQAYSVTSAQCINRIQCHWKVQKSGGAMQINSRRSFKRKESVSKTPIFWGEGMCTLGLGLCWNSLVQWIWIKVRSYQTMYHKMEATQPQKDSILSKMKVPKRIRSFFTSYFSKIHKYWLLILDSWKKILTRTSS